MTNDKVRCSFCGKREDEVSQLIAGTHAFICDTCIDLCHETVTKERERRKPSGSTR